MCTIRMYRKVTFLWYTYEIINSRFDNDSLYHLIILNIRFLFSINAVNPKSISETLQNSNNQATANQWWVNHGHINSDESITFAAARFVRKVYPEHPSYIETYCPWVDKKRVLLLLGQYTFIGGDEERNNSHRDDEWTISMFQQYILVSFWDFY